MTILKNGKEIVLFHVWPMTFFPKLMWRIFEGLLSLPSQNSNYQIVSLRLVKVYLKYGSYWPLSNNNTKNKIHTSLFSPIHSINQWSPIVSLSSPPSIPLSSLSLIFCFCISHLLQVGMSPAARCTCITPNNESCLFCNQPRDEATCIPLRWLPLVY